jgi:hypothetical protein
LKPDVKAVKANRAAPEYQERSHRVTARNETEHDGDTSDYHQCRSLRRIPASLEGSDGGPWIKGRGRFHSPDSGGGGFTRRASASCGLRKQVGGSKRRCNKADREQERAQSRTCECHSFPRTDFIRLLWKKRASGAAGPTVAFTGCCDT